MEPLIIRADSSTEMGVGHAMRCVALGQEWKRRGGEVKFLHAEMLPAILDRIHGEGFLGVSVPGPSGSSVDQSVLCSLLKERPAFLAIDGYSFDELYVRGAANLALGALAFDDFGHLKGFDSYLLLNQNIHANAALYPEAKEKELLLGPPYVLLREEIRGNGAENLFAPPERGHLLITLGGGDPQNFTLKILQCLRATSSSLARLTVLVGPGHPDPESLERERIHWGTKLSLLRDCRQMGQLLRGVDIAITAGGSTLWELCFFGVPPMVFTLAKNQMGIASELQRLGFAADLGWAHSFDPDRLKSELMLLLERDIREKRSQVGRGIVDGKGCQRVVDALRSFRSSEP
jgi:UDP-2,4-diacetamido-2,4,6-trideoxy-beta-L-altropyranose hydrolase